MVKKNVEYIVVIKKKLTCNVFTMNFIMLVIIYYKTAL